MSVHFKNAQWVDIQRRFLDRFLDVDHKRVFQAKGIAAEVFLPGEEILPYSGSHAEGLDALAQHVMKEAADDDVLFFVDSDAFPVSPISEMLSLVDPLVAVRRSENDGDPQPHPCFTLSTAGFWRSMPTSWASGYHWRNRSFRKVTDVGANLLQLLQTSDTTWQPIERLNRRGLHPLWFGLYGVARDKPLAYHHGAGSRTRLSRADLRENRQMPWVRKRLERERLEWLASSGRWETLGLLQKPLELPGADVLSEALIKKMSNDFQFWRGLI